MADWQRACVYTCMIGRYEKLNEQPVAVDSQLPFVCLTDDAELRSSTWRLIRIDPLFPMDFVRSQRLLKLLPHRFVPDFDVSLYIDNSVVLTQKPEDVLDRYLASSDLALPTHSYRDRVVDEFAEITANGLDDPERVAEQLDHYRSSDAAALDEKPYWTAIQLRRHGSPQVRRAMEIWAAHVLRYSRRDQLSANAAFRQAQLRPQALEIDNFKSWFHTWPHLHDRVRRPAKSESVLLQGRIAALDEELGRASWQIRQQQDRIAALDQELAQASGQIHEQQDRIAALDQELAQASGQIRQQQDRIAALDEESAQASGQIRRQHDRITALGEELVQASGQIRRQHDRITALGEELVQASGQIHQQHDQITALGEELMQASGQIHQRQDRITALDEELAQARGQIQRHAATLDAMASSRSWRMTSPLRAMHRAAQRLRAGAAFSKPSDSVRCSNGRTIYVDPHDQRGRSLISSGGDFNPSSLAMWRSLLAECEWTHVIDVGANYGEMLVGVELPRSATTIALEPNPLIVPHLKRTLREAGLKVQVIAQAASARSGTATLNIDRDWSGLSSSAGVQAASIGHTVELKEVSTTTLAFLIDENSTDPGAVRLLVKINVEGHEVPVLQGLGDTLENIGEFAAMVEILHIGEADLEWLLGHFGLELLDIENGKLTPIDACTAAELHSRLAENKLYRQDAVLRRRPRTKTASASSPASASR